MRRSPRKPRKQREKTSKYQPLPKESRRVVEYWLQSVIDGRRMSLSPQDIEQAGIVVTQGLYQQGVCRPDVLATITAKALSTGNGRNLEVLLAPVYFRREQNKGGGYAASLICPLLIPAVIGETGELSPSEHLLPWVPRDFLEPLPPGRSLVLGEIQVYENFLERNSLPRGSGWKAYRKYCESLTTAVLDAPLERLEIPGYRRGHESLLLLDTSGGGGSHVERLYRDVLNEKRSAGLLPAIASLKEPKRRLAGRSAAKIARGTLRHTGQFEYHFPLSPTQRRAVQEATGLRSGEVLSISGPPGTGKTTLIQSIVASLWVEAARLNNNAPPVIVVCSATNQAVTNVIDSFAKANTRPGPLGGRWLPGTDSYGTFCASRSKAQEVSGIPVETTDGNGTFADWERWDYLQEARHYYLGKFREYAGPAKNIPQCLNHLRKELKHEYSLLHRDVSHALHGDIVQRLKRLFRLLPALDPASLNEALESLDTTHRHTAFQLATHYWEGRWLLELEKRLQEKEEKNGPLWRSKAEWQTFAMRTPCFVSTFSMAPRYFGANADAHHAAIDLLIADEAGQAAPEIAGATFALAEKALVIGDTEQLQPVWSVTPHVDFGNLLRTRLLKAGDEHGKNRLERAGILAGSGSLMKRAIRVCPVQDESVAGIFLSEHRRSVPEIVHFANLLSYRNRLEAKRPRPEKRILPPFGYAHVQGAGARAGRSRLNRIEGESIAAWLIENGKRIEQHYEQPLAECVAVVTPFAAQAQLLRTLIRRQHPQMTVGTIYSLQGAERPIVIFSPVYDSSERGTYFFDRTPNMLNVAVTRAKDSFLVFGDMRIFNENGRNYSGLLAKFLFARSAHRLKEITPARNGIAKKPVPPPA